MTADPEIAALSAARAEAYEALSGALVAMSSTAWLVGVVIRQEAQRAADGVAPTLADVRSDARLCAQHAVASADVRDADERLCAAALAWSRALARATAI